MAREDVNIKVSANVAEAIQLWKAMEAGPEGMAKSLDAMGKKGKTASESAGESVLAMATKFASASAIIGGIVSGLKAMEETAQAAADRVKSSLGAYGELQQISRTPQEFAQHVARARNMVGRVVGKEESGKAAEIVFSMASAGYSEAEKDFIEKLGESKFIGTTEGVLGLSEGLAKYRRTFGEKDAGTIPQIADKVIAAAGTAQATVPETMKGILKSAGQGTQMGLTDEQHVAGLLAVEAFEPNMEMASTDYAAFLTQVNKKGLWKGDMKSTMDFIKKKQGKGSAFNVLGESSAVIAYEYLQKSGEFYAQQEELLRTAPEQKLFEKRSGFMKEDPILNAAMAAEKSEGLVAKKEEEVYAEKEALLDAYWNEKKKQNLDKYGGFWGGAANIFEGVGLYGIDWAQAEREQFGSMPPSEFDALSPTLQGQIKSYNARNGSLIPRPRDATRHITGPQEVKIIAPDGLDLPHEPAATGLNQ